MKKKLKKIILVLIIFLILLIGVGFAYVYTDLLKTDKQLFIKYLGDNINQFKNFNIEPFGSFFREDQTETLESNINIQVKPKEEDEEIKKISIDLTFLTDMNSKETAMKLDAKTDENEFLKYDVVFSDKMLGIKINGVYDKYLGIKNENLKEFVKKLEMPEETLNAIPDKIDFYQTTNITDENIEKTKDLLKKHSQILMDLIEKGEYQKNKGVEVDINGQMIKTNKYNFTISQKELIDAIMTFMKDLVNDEEFVDLYFTDYNKAQLQEIKDSIKSYESMTEFDDDSKVTISVYESKGKTVRTDIINEESEVSWQILNNENESNIIISSKEKTPEGEKQYFPDSENIVKIQNKANGNNGQIIIEVEKIYDKDDIEKLNADAKKEAEEFAEEYSFYDYEEMFDYSSRYEDSSERYIVNCLKKDNNNIELSLDLNNLEEVEAKVKMQIKLGTKVNIEKLNEENTLILNEYTQEDFAKLGEELQGNMQKTAEQNPMWVFSIMNQRNNGILAQAQENTKENIKYTIREAIALTNADAIANYYSSQQTISIAEYTVNFFTVENIKKNCMSSIVELELVGDNNFKITTSSGEIYYAKVMFVENNGNISAENIEIFTEEEYNQ